MAAPNVHLSFAVRARPHDVRLRLMPAALTDGYTLIDELPNGFAVRRRRVPVWAIVLAVILFPLGLVFLLVRTDDDVTVALSNVYGGTGVTITGRASPGLQRALQTALAIYQPAGMEAQHAEAPEEPEARPPVPVAAPEEAPAAPVPLAPPVGFPGGGLPGGMPGGGFPGGLAGGGPPGGLLPMPLGVPPPLPPPPEGPGEDG